MSTVQGGQGNIVTNGLILNLDAANPRSYPPAYNGTTWFDLSGNSNNGTLTNGPTYSTANGGGLLFDGTDDYVNISYSSIFNIQNFTLSIWVRFSSFDSFNALITNPQTGTISGGWVNPYLSWMLRINSNTNIEVGIGSNSTYTPSNFSYTFSTNTNYNIVATYNGSLVIAYVNSSLINQNSVSATINYTSKPVVLGTDYGGSFSNCFIYQTQMYNRALSAAEINQNFQATRARFGI